MIKELILKEVVRSISKILVGMATKEGNSAGLNVNEKDLDDALAHHTKYVANWSGQISLKDMQHSRSLNEIFVLPTYFQKTSNREIIHFSHLLTSNYHTVILGGPGAGKTTAIKMICQYLFHNEGGSDDIHSFPLLVRLRTLKNDESLIDHILSNIGIIIEFHGLNNDKHPTQTYKENVKERILVEYIDKLRPLLLLDGLDEIPSERTFRIIQEVQKLSNLLSLTRIVMTSRIGAINVFFDNSEIVYTSPFTKEQIIEFSNKWFVDKELANQFITKINNTPYFETIERPLTLAHLCMIYDAYGELPESPSIVYQKIISLLLEEWDRQRDIKRLSRYGNFGIERKKMFLAALAYELCSEGYRSVFEEGDLLRVYRKICSKFGLKLDERQNVLREIESHSGLVVQSGFSTYEFSHKTMQEYLCADHISRIPNLKTHFDKLVMMPNECAIATILSADPNEFFQFLAINLIVNNTGADHQSHLFWSQYISRLNVEKVQFESTPNLGVAYLLVASTLWDETKDGSGKYVMDSKGTPLFEAIEDLLINKKIQNSLEIASKGLMRIGTGKNILKVAIKKIKKAQFESGLPDYFIVSKQHIPPNNSLHPTSFVGG